MLKRSFREYLLLFPPAVGTLCLASLIWIPQPAIVPWPTTGVVGATECVASLILLLALAFLLPHPYEIELGLVCGVKTTRLAFSKVVPIASYTVMAIWATVACHRQYPDASTEFGTQPPADIYVPDNYKGYLMLSALITVLFFSALFLFFRVLTRNCCLPLVFGILAFSCFDNANIKIQNGSVSLTRCIWDPFITTYFIGDTVPNAIAEQHTDLASLANAWTHNRLLFFGLALALFVAGWLLLRREKLHKGLSD